MKKLTLTNGALFNIVDVLFDPDNFRSNKNIKTRIAVRQALKINIKNISDLFQPMQELRNELIQETTDEYIKAGKASKSDEGGFKVFSEYSQEYVNEVNKRIQELFDQTVELEIQTIPEKEYLKYAQDNDGLFSDAELDVLELFVEFDEQNDKTE